jgi:hypothetical protein
MRNRNRKKFTLTLPRAVRPRKPNHQMKKRIHPYLEPKLIIHTNGSTYLTGIPLLYTLSTLPLAISEGTSSGAESLITLASRADQHNSLSWALTSPVAAAKEKMANHSFSGYLIKYLSLPSSGCLIAPVPTAELQLAQPLHGSACIALDTDTFSNPL